MATIANLVATLGLDASGYDRTVQQVTKSAGGLGAAINSAVSTATGFIAANVAMSAFGKATEAVSGGIIGMNASLQKSTLQFETLMGSADQAREHVKMLFDFAKATPFETQPIIEASRMLQTFGGAALNTRENLLKIGDAAAATNAPIQELGFWVGRAYSAISAGRPFGEAAMRLQELAVLSPQARAEMERLQEAGASASEVWAVMEKDLGRFEGAMKRQAGTWEGLTSTFSDTVAILSSMAFRPFFEMVSSGLTQINEWLGREDVTRWAERIATALRLAMQAFGNLASFVGAALGSVLRIVQTLGQAIWNALQWLNPFARHSPSLVEQVEAGVSAITAAYAGMAPAISGHMADVEAAVRALETATSEATARLADSTRADTMKLVGALGAGAAGAWAQATDALGRLEDDLAGLGAQVSEAEAALRRSQEGLEVLEEGARAARDEVESLEAQLSAAERALRHFTTAPLEGTQAFSDALFENEQAVRRLQLQMAEMKLGGAAKEQLEPLEKELDRLRTLGERIRLQEALALEPQRRELEKLANTQRELTFAEARAGALAARAEMEALGPAIAAAQEKALMAEEAAAKQAALVEEQRGALESIKGRYDELSRAADSYRESIEGIVAAAREMESLQRAAAGAAGGPAAGTEAMQMAVAAAAPAPAAGLAEAAEQVEGWVQGASQAVANFDSALFKMQVRLGEIGHAFELLFDPERRQIGIDFFVGLFQSILGTVREKGQEILGRLLELAAGFAEWVGPAIPDLLSRLGELGQAVLAWIVEVAPTVADRLGEWAGQFVAWVGPKIPELLSKLGDLLNNVRDWIVAQLPELAARITTWADAFVEWVEPQVAALLTNLGTLMSSLLDWITENAPPLVERFIGEWVPAAIAWVADAAIKILPELLRFVATVTGWIVTEGVPKIGQALLAIGDWIVKEGVPKLLELAVKMGEAIIKGIAKGLRNIKIPLPNIWVSTEEGPLGIQIPRLNIGVHWRSLAEWIPELAAGGWIARAGWAFVGERGPELAWLPQGAAVMPLSASPAAVATSPGVAGGGGTTIIIEGPIYGFDDFESRVVEALERASLRGRRS